VRHWKCSRTKEAHGFMTVLIENSKSSLPPFLCVGLMVLGRDETGAPNEPIDVNEHNDQVEFERRFREMLSPWTQADLKLTCERCKVAGETVSHRTFQNYWTTGTNSIQYKEQELCRDCYEKTLQELYTQVKEARAQGEKKETS